MRKLGLIVAIGTVIATGAYVFVYLYRWEWNRAIMSATLFLAAEVALVAILLTNRLRALEARTARPAVAERRGTARIVREAAPPPRVGFAWLARPDRMNVFVPVLLAGGVLLTGIAWVIERLARLTGKSATTRSIVRRLDRLTLPPNGFLEPVDDGTRLLRGPLVR
ncbi:hypothetical protein [Nocardia transvalensis]|uniref:hypothetical protein n=1 Tax=Nocardia transvalensis TaxID=37333 RepID=UPI0018932E49|nr:hypothetical protein [Nocardia transvalensis]MBF6328198.1 hypothetical protein [Nocardia transvalensis]